MKRRDLLKAILAAGIAPAVVKAESLMRLKTLPSGLVVPLEENIIMPDGHRYLFSTSRAEMELMELFGRNAAVTLNNLITDVCATPTDAYCFAPNGCRPLFRR